MTMSKTYEEHAWLYDAAFSWDVGEEVDWLLERMGGAPRSVLEPACGSGRMFPAFVRRGVQPTGVDRSAAMLARARERMRSEGLAEPELGRTFEDRDDLRLWDWASWSALIAASPFRQARAYDARRTGRRPPLEPGPELDGLKLTWHELVRV